MSLKDVEKNLTTRVSEVTQKIEDMFTSAHTAFDDLEKKLESQFGPTLNTTFSIADFGNIVAAFTTMASALSDIQNVIKNGESLTQELVTKVEQAVVVYNNVKTLLGVK